MLRSTNDVQGAAAGLTFLVIGLFFCGVGYLVSSRLPRNPVGWMFHAVGLLFVLQVSTATYALHGLVEAPGSLPGALGAGWVNRIVGGPIFFTPFIFVLLLFPSGELPSPRWKWLRTLAFVAAAGLLLVTALSPGPLLVAPLTDNPVGWNALADIQPLADGILGVAQLLCAVGAAVSPIVRFRRAPGEERQQLKWLAFAAGLLGATLAMAPILWSSLVPTWVWPVTFGTSVLLLPATAAIGILKYRLYDIDVIINRTLVYATLSLTLAFTYLASIVLLQQILPVARESDLSVAASTLAVAALFRPARARIQHFIDRRFYRSRYDATATLTEFGARLRDELHLDMLAGEIGVIVQKTLQPAHVSLWIRPPSGRDDA